MPTDGTEPLWLTRVPDWRTTENCVELFTPNLQRLLFRVHAHYVLPREESTQASRRMQTEARNIGIDVAFAGAPLPILAGINEQEHRSLAAPWLLADRSEILQLRCCRLADPLLF